MALFGLKKDKKQNVSTTKVRPIVIRTQNVAKELLNVAKLHNVKVEDLDFNILEIQTYTRTLPEDKQEVDWQEVDSDDLYSFDTEEILLNKLFQIKQMYEIEIFSTDKDDETYKNFHLAVGANSTKCKVYLSIKAGSSVEYNRRFEKDLKRLIEKKKARAGILLHIFDEDMHSVVSKIYATVKVQEKVKYVSNETFLIAQSYEPTPSKDDELILHYEKSDNLDDTKKANYSSRGFIKGVQCDELLIEYKKPVFGQAGRNCRGEYIEPKQPAVKNEPKFKVDSTIRVEENEESICYYAKDNGYIDFKNGIYTIKSELDVNVVSFKATGYIEAGVDSEVSMVVKEKDLIKDAIGMGMFVEVSELEVEGNVGPNAKVHAMKATIGGQVHKSAKLYADRLEVNVLKGYASGRNVKVQRLEHGLIESQRVEVSQALGGEIKADNIQIHLCNSYVKATASQRIEIEKMHGSENIFTIDPLVREDFMRDVSECEAQMKFIKSEMIEIKKDIQNYINLIKDGLSAFNDLKKRLLHYKKNGVKMPEAFVKKYKRFQSMQEKLKLLKEDYRSKEEHLKLLESNKVSVQSDIEDARIINNDRWVGFNEIRFKLVEPPITLTYKPKEGSEDKIFGVVKVDEGEYEIKVMKE